jgi:hypothetical protein
LGYGDLSTLSPESKERVCDEAEGPPSSGMMRSKRLRSQRRDKASAPSARLQTLLAAHHELGERGLDVEYEAIERQMGGGPATNDIDSLSG